MIVIDGKGSTATFGSTAIANLLKIKIDTLRGEREFIDLTGLADAVVNGEMSQVKDWKTIVLTVKTDPAVVNGLTDDNAQLVIAAPVAVGKSLTAWAQIETDGGLELETKKRGETDITFRLTNRNSSGAVTAPILA